MKLLILEGVATSGKSTVTHCLQEQLRGRTVQVADESETHIPIMRLTGRLHIVFFQDLIDRLVSENPELLIFDRLYLTQAFRAGVPLDEYAAIEGRLASLGAITAFLSVEPATIAERVSRAAEHRDPSWSEYIRTKGKDMNEIAHYYARQQESQLRLLETSRLPYVVYDTTRHEYAQVTRQILERLGQN